MSTNTSTPEPVLHRIREVARRLSIDDRLLHVYIARGLVRVVRVAGHAIRIHEDEVQRLIRGEGLPSPANSGEVAR